MVARMCHSECGEMVARMCRGIIARTCSDCGETEMVARMCSNCGEMVARMCSDGFTGPEAQS